MLFFDPAIWRDRAWKRFQRSVRKEKIRQPSRGAEEQWYRDALYIDKLQRLIKWCAYRKLEVVFGKRENGVYYPESKEMVITGRAAPEKQLHYILHECGHHLIGMKEQHERFGMGYPQQDAAITRTLLHRIACLEEEFEAWHRGWKLAKRLRLGVDREEFDKTRLDCVRSYVKWTARAK
jgi:hypothetical protein